VTTKSARLPPELEAKVAAARQKHVLALARFLTSHFHVGGGKDPGSLVDALHALADDALDALARESYAQGLATAGDATKALEDLETLRAAARILTGGPVAEPPSVGPGCRRCRHGASPPAGVAAVRRAGGMGAASQGGHRAPSPGPVLHPDPPALPLRRPAQLG
jgi:hypothetical protein